MCIELVTAEFSPLGDKGPIQDVGTPGMTFGTVKCKQCLQEVQDVSLPAFFFPRGFPPRGSESCIIWIC